MEATPRNARLHIANSVIHFLATKNIETVSHQPYNPDVAPNYLFFYPTAKIMLKGWTFFSNTVEAVKALGAVLKNISMNDIQKVFEEWQRRRKKCMALNGGYVDREKSLKPLM